MSFHERSFCERSGFRPTGAMLDREHLYVLLLR
jgi:hypothetical protein